MILVSGAWILAAAAVAAAPTADDLARLTPVDAQVVLGLNAAALRSHPTVQGWLEDHSPPLTGRAAVEELLRETGLDPLRDVEAAVLAAAYRGEGVPPAFLALFGGSFNPPSLAAALTKRGATLVPAPFVLLRTAEAAGEAPFVAVLDRLLAVGDEASVRAAVAGTTLGAAVVRVERAAGRLDPRASLWLAVDMPAAWRQRNVEMPATPPSVSGVVQASRAVTRLLAHARLGAALELDFWARANSVENAELLQDAVRGAIAALRLAAQEHLPELVDVLRGVRITQHQEEVSGQASVPLPLLDRLAHPLQAVTAP